MDKDGYISQVETFLEENHFTELPRDPTDSYQKQIQQAISRSSTLIDKQQKKYLTQIKPQPPTLKAQIKIHKDNEPIRPVVNSIQAPTHKIAKFLNRWLTDTLQLPNTFVTPNSTSLAHELTKLQITESDRLITYDIKGLYVNIPLKETTNITRKLLTDKKIHDTTVNQACTLLTHILQQNYLQFNYKFYQPNKGVAMGSPISGLIAEIFLQHLENNILKNSLDSQNIRFYNRYVVDILIIYDSSKTNPTKITLFMNNIHKSLQFTPTAEINNTTNFLDLSVTRQHNKLTLNIYRKPTTTDTTIHYSTNHLIEHKTAAYRFLLNRMHRLTITQEHKEQEMNTIYQIARKNGYTKQSIDKLNTQITKKTQRPNQQYTTYTITEQKMGKL
jgi:hypothetical protein